MQDVSAVRRRTAVEIVHEILSVCDDDGARRTAIMYRCNLNFFQLKRYLSGLSDKKLIWENDAGRYQLTPKGQATLSLMVPAVQTMLDLRLFTEPDTPLTE